MPAQLHLTHLLKQISDTRGTDTNKQLHKLRGGTAEEGYACLSSNGLSQQGLACAWGAHQQTPLGDLGSQLSVFVRVLEKVKNLLKLNLGLVYSLQYELDTR